MTLSKYTLSVGLLLLWAVAIALAFWWFQFRHISSFDNYLASFNGQTLKDLRIQPIPSKDAVVMHFIDPECPCSRFSKPHIRKLELDYAQQADFSYWDNQHAELSSLEIPASPAVAIWSADGKLAYFGPYSAGAVCGEGEDFVASIIDKLQQGHNPQWINQDAVGCFCPWPAASQPT